METQKEGVAMHTKSGLKFEFLPSKNPMLVRLDSILKS